MSDDKILRKYIRESLLTEFGLSDISSIFGFGGSKGSGPQKWFSDFMSRQLDKASDDINDFLVAKISGNQVTSGSDDVKDDATEALADFLAVWFEDTEKASGKRFSKSEKEKVSSFAAEEFSNLMRKTKNLKRALIEVKRKLDEQYASSKKPEAS